MAPVSVSPPPDLLTIWQAGFLLGCSPTVVRRLVRAGTLPASRLPGTNGPYVVRRDDVVAFAQERQGGAQ